MALPHIPEDLIGRELWLMFARDQVARGLSDEIDSVLLDAFKDIVRRILTEYDDLGPRQADRLAGLFNRVSNLLAERYGSVSSQLTVALQDFGDIEAAIARDEIALRVGRLGTGDVGFGLITRSRVTAVADLMIEGQRLPEWWRTQARRMSDATRRQIQIGLTLGEGPADIVRRIIPARGAVAPAVYRQARRDATTLVRTAVTAVSNQAHFDTYQQVSDRYQWVAIRDARTTPICRALDGKVFRFDDPGAPLPPAHMNCRSTIMPLLGEQGLASDAPGNVGPGGWRDYNSWLRAQPDTDQRKILGPSRWDLWRTGKVSLEEMVNSDSRTLTLAQLRLLIVARETAGL